jgi:hypothetical protein
MNKINGYFLLCVGIFLGCITYVKSIPGGLLPGGSTSEETSLVGVESGMGGSSGDDAETHSIKPGIFQKNNELKNDTNVSISDNGKTVSRDVGEIGADQLAEHQLNFPSISAFFNVQGSQSESTNEILKYSEEKINQIKNEFYKQKEKISKEVQSRSRNVHEKVDYEMKRIKQQAEASNSRLQKEFFDIAEQLKRQTSGSVLNIIETAEQAIYEEQRRKRMELFNSGISNIPSQSKIPSFQSIGSLENLGITNTSLGLEFSSKESKENVIVTSGREEILTKSWRNELEKKFYDDMTYIRDIIIKGELKSEINDFEKTFKEQTLWFDNTMRTAKHEGDSFYLKLLAKQKEMHVAVDTQRKADAYFMKVLENISLSPEQKNNVRLLSLYDINSLLQKKKKENEKDDKKNAKISLDMHEIQGIVNRIVEKFSFIFKEREGQLKDVILVDNKTQDVIPIMVKKLESNLDKTKKELVLLKKDKEKLEKTSKEEMEKFKKYSQDTVEKERKKNIECKIQLKNKDDVVLHAKNERKLAEKELDIAHQEALQARNEIERLGYNIAAVEREGMEEEIELVRENETIALSYDNAIQNINNKHIRTLEAKNKENLGLTVEVRKLNKNFNIVSNDNKKLDEQFKRQQLMTDTLNKKVEVIGKNALSLETDLRTVREKNSITDKFDKTKLMVQEESLRKSELSKEISDKTIKMINDYLMEQKKVINETISMLSKKEKEHVNNKILMDEILEQKKEIEKSRELLQHERNMLKNLRQKASQDIEKAVKGSYEERISNKIAGNVFVNEMKKFRDDVVNAVNEGYQRLNDLKQQEILSKRRLQQINEQIRHSFQQGKIAALRNRRGNMQNTAYQKVAQAKDVVID